jgi:hypothetical protein
MRIIRFTVFAVAAVFMSALLWPLKAHEHQKIYNPFSDCGHLCADNTFTERVVFFFMLDSLREDGFGYWLSGFVDGEGCFIICSFQGSHKTRFQLKLRRDDEHILKEIMRRVGVGRIYYEKSLKRTSQPNAKWVIDSKHGCETIAAIFTAFPLRAKKSRDFKIWREAVGLITEIGGEKVSRHPNQKVLAKLEEKLKDIRKYKLGQQSLHI